MKMTNYYEDALQLLQRLICCPSFSKQEQGTAEILYQFLVAKNVVVYRSQNNVWAFNKYYEASKPTLLLNSHHDTVAPNHSYTNNPFCPIIKDDKLYGLGSNDAGASLVALLMCFLNFYNHQNLAFNIVFAATAEEEISGKNGIESVLPHLGKVSCAIVGEPTLMQAAVTERGLLVLDITVKGVAGHAARNEGENAIYKSLPIIHWFQNYKFPKESNLLGAVKMSVTQVNAGSQHNVVPDECNLVVDIRVNDCYELEEIVATIKAAINTEFKVRSLRLKSTSIPAQHPLVLAAQKTGAFCFGSSTLSDKALMPFPALKIGPGDSARSHTADEFIFLHELEEGIKTYIQILKNLEL